MARIRTVKPEYFRHEGLQDLESANPGCHTMLVFAGLWGQCDKNGRFEWKPRTLKLDILPFIDFDMGKTLSLLCEAGFVRKYINDGREYGEIESFEKHQRISGKEAQEPGKHPAPIEYIQGSIGEAPEKQLGWQEGKGREREEEGKGKDKYVEALHARREQVAAVFSHWQKTLGHDRAVLDDKRRKIIDARLKEGYSIETLLAAIDGCSKSPFHMGENDRGMKYDGLDLILRDGAHIDQFIKINDNPPRPSGKQAKIESINRAAGEDFLRAVDIIEAGGNVISGEFSHA